MPRRNTNILSEAAGVNVRCLKIGAHRVVLVPAVMAFAARNMVSDDYTLSNFEPGDSFASLDDRSG